MLIPNLIALDFDGVICDGLLEYFQTTQKAYCQIWQTENTEHFAHQFYQLRPVIETGWEMPILLRALVLNYSDQEILDHWPIVRDKIIQSENIEPKKVGLTVDQIRDHWIESDLESWLNLHRFYPGISETIKQILNQSQFYIITTKEGRFVKQLLQQTQIDLNPDFIFGKEIKQPKYETIRQIIKNYHNPNLTVWFIEDRLEALEQVAAQSDLNQVKLFLADWGYNTAKTRASLIENQRINLLSLADFNQGFQL
jgi:phosphoglycolate phosphatase-like HAD superfamily hydrolase